MAAVTSHENTPDTYSCILEHVEYLKVISRNEVYYLLNRSLDEGPREILLNDPNRVGGLTANSSKFHDITL